MPINPDEIEKYIFDPENPKQCKTYNLFLNILKKEHSAFISPDFVRYFFRDDIITEEFKEQLWDIPENFDSLTINKKLEIFEKQLSEQDLKDYLKSLDINRALIDKRVYKDVNNNTDNTFFKYSVYLKELIGFSETEKVGFGFDRFHPFYKNLQKIIFINGYNTFFLYEHLYTRVSIAITLDTPENIEFFTKNEEYSSNIKPLFLKRMEDVDLLLKVAESDIEHKTLLENHKVEEISTIDSIKVKNFFSIKDIELENLRDKKEIYIVGENGDGKTLFLQSIIFGLRNLEKGKIAEYLSGENPEIEIVDSLKTQLNFKRDIDAEPNYKYILAYGTNRSQNCSTKKDELGFLTLFDGCFDLEDPIEWLKLIDYREKSGKENILSLKTAKELISDLLEKKVEIDVSVDGVKFIEKGSEIEFRQLSTGYKNVITLISDIVSRLSKLQPKVTDIKDFGGVILIDEVELHLHPKWKYEFIHKLREWLPKVQFIFTTHSPTLILGASKDAVFYKLYKEDGEVKISGQIQNSGDWTSNTIVTSPIFNLYTMASRDRESPISSDDYIYEKIHKVISERVQKMPDIPEDELLTMINELFDEEESKIERDN